MAEYKYQLENNEYFLYEDGKMMTTPHGAVIKTENENLAKELIEELDAGKGFTSPSSLLTYHYTYCNLREQYDLKTLVEKFSISANCVALMSDEYLLFHQPSPIKQAYATYFEQALPECFKSYNFYQFAAIMVVLTAYESMMLAYYIIIDIYEKMLKNETADYQTLKEEFLEDLQDYELEQFGIDFDNDNPHDEHLQNIDNMIDAFVQYFNL